MKTISALASKNNTGRKEPHKLGQVALSLDPQYPQRQNEGGALVGTKFLSISKLYMISYWIPVKDERVRNSMRLRTMGIEWRGSAQTISPSSLPKEDVLLI
jgi:hypothetical protein